MKASVTAKDVYGNSFEIPKNELKWRPSAYGIIVDNEKVLLLPQYGDKFDIPGGGVDLGESIEDAVIREVKEETGYDVAAESLVDCVESFFVPKHDPSDPEAYHSLLFYYKCKIVGGELSTEGFDEWEKKHANMAVWFDIKKIDTINPASTVDFRPILNKVLEGKS